MLARRLAHFLAPVLALAASSASAGMDVQKTGLGRLLAEERCGSCHALSRGELSPNAAAPPFADVVKTYPPETLEEALAEGIMVGHPDMPEFTFTAEQVELLIAYLKSLE